MRAAVVNTTTNVVENVIEFGENYPTPEDTLIVESDTASIGDTYADGIFTSPPPPEDPPAE